MPTSSSSSTYSSQTSSSSSRVFSSSSSSGFCKTPDCVGEYCSNFSSWIINGLNDSYSGSVVYVILTRFGSEQQVELYSDPNYYNLIALGKRGSAGLISLSQRNSSGITASVLWDGTLIASGPTLELYCEELSSTSSSSSIDSSSSKSQSSFSDTSSSSNCCVNPYHQGDADSYFSGWTLAGMNDSNSNGCELFVGLDVVSGSQQVRIYKDAELYTLVSIGERTTSGSIVLDSVNGSGLTGSVNWDGTLVYYPSVIYLSCNDFSSSSTSLSSSSISSSSSSFDSSSSSSFDSSSSSTSNSSSSSSSSVDSSSSSSSSSVEDSSSSSKSSSSSSSQSTQSLSSSSSIDSSSSSSESIGNFSSSSSSSLEMWNKGKPLFLGTTSIKTQFVNNKIGQTIFINEMTYDIGKIFCYFYGPFGDVSGGTIKMDLLNCLDDGSPNTIIATSSLDSSTITAEGWYAFEIDASGNTPSNGYLSFVMYMEDLDENNYVMWAYKNCNNDNKNRAWLLVNGVWTFHQNVERSIKLVSKFEAFDLENFRLNSPPSVTAMTIPLLNTNLASYTRTAFNSGTVEIDNPTAIVSFVLDASGSNGWTDRFGNRIDFVSKMFDKFHSFYPSAYYADYIKFGSIVLDIDRFFGQIGQPASINLDLNSPSRTTYIFETNNAVSVLNGDTYSVNGLFFEILRSADDGAKVYAVGDTDPATTSGILALTDGFGQGQIHYTSFTKATIEDGVIAYGLKNIESGHVYSIGPLVIDDTTFDTVSISNLDLFHGNLETQSYSISASGPNSKSFLNVTCGETTVIRKAFVSTELPKTTFSDKLRNGDTTITISDANSVNVNSRYDFMDGDMLSPNHLVTSKNGNVITITPPIYYEIKSSSERNSIAQQSSFYSTKPVNGTTAKIMVKDTAVSREVTFYLQTSAGLLMEWDFYPFSDWVYNNLFWLGETATLPFEAFDEEGDPLPDGTRLDINVDKDFLPKADIVSDKQLVADAINGSDVIYIDNVTGIKKDDKFNIIDNQNKNQLVTISEIGTDANGSYVKIYETLSHTFYVSNASIMQYSQSSASSLSDILSKTGSKISVPLGVVDVTPIQVGKNIDPSLLQEYDGLQVPYTETYESINLKKEYVHYMYHDVPTIDGFASVRFLPITEDNFKTIEQKKKEAEKILRMMPPSNAITQLKKNSLDNKTTTAADLTDNVDQDYSIETPVYLYSGYAKSHMSSTSTTLTDKNFYGLNYPGDKTRGVTIPSRTYKLNPAITIESETGATIGQQILKTIDVDFATPIMINSRNKDNKKVYFWAWSPPKEDGGDGECPPEFKYEKYYLDGVCATGEPYTINYSVYNKLNLIKSGNLQIKIYSNRTVDMDAAVDNFVLSESMEGGKTPAVSPSQFFINPPTKFVQEDGATKEQLSKITNWRKLVISNSASHTLSTNAYEAYSNPEQWELAKQYTAYNFSIPIVNGKASLTIPSSDIPSLLMVEATYSFGNQMEAVRTDFVVIANPITVGPWIPDRAKPSKGTEIYEIGTDISWKFGVDGIIEDGTVVDLTNPESSMVKLSPITPSVSQTSNGWAGGFKMGPRTPIITDDSCLTNSQEEQIIVVTVNHSSGFTTKVKRRFKWDAIYEKSSLPNLYFFVKADYEDKKSWADGDENTGSVIVDLNSKTNRTIYTMTDSDYPIADEYKEAYKGPSQSIEDILLDESSNDPDTYIDPISGIPVIWVGEFGRDRLLGLEQENALPTNVTVSQGTPIFTPTTARWDSPKLSFKVLPFNKCVGDVMTVKAGMKTYYSVKNPYANNQVDISTGIITTEMPKIGVTESGGSSVAWESPKAIYYEPLSIHVEFESYNNSSIDASNFYENALGYGTEPFDSNHSFVRNGVDSVNIVATVAWKGKRITNKFVANEGTANEFTMDFPMPTVRFECGLCSEVNCKKDKDKLCIIDEKTGIGIPLDNRGQWHNCIRIDPHPDFNLSSYVVDASNSRTTKHGDGENIHTHECIVDDNGNGRTTRTIVLKGVVADHTHDISNHISGYFDGHNHETRTVAIVTLLPTKTTGPTIVAKATATYDPTNCEPYGNEEQIDNANRKVFASAQLGGYDITQRDLVIDILAGNDSALYSIPDEVSDSNNLNEALTFYTSKNIEDFENGFNISTELYYKEYVTESESGVPIIVPKEKVPDGTRVILTFEAYKPPSNILDGESTGSTFIVAFDKPRTCMLLKIGISACVGDRSISKSLKVLIKSNLQWLPGYKSLVPEPTNDKIIMQNALTKINSLGASQVYDAITLAAQRALQFTKDNSITNAKHIIFILSDGDENTSTTSLSQSISNVHFISGIKNTPAINGVLGASCPTDMAMMKYISAQTSGFTYGLKDYDGVQMDDLIDSVLKNNRFVLNNGIYADVIQMDVPSSIKSIKIDGSVSPNGSSIYYRFRTSDDMVEWGIWSDWRDISLPIDVSDKEIHKFISYEVSMGGNSTFNSPQLTQGAVMTYQKPQSTMVYFNTTGIDCSNDEFLSSIHITHSGLIPETSEVQYGISQNETVDPDDFIARTRGWIKANEYSVLLPRMNEQLQTEDYVNYTNPNGRWAENAIIKIRKFNDKNPYGVEISKTEYSSNPQDGLISFYASQLSGDIFMMDVEFNPSFRLICKITNYGEETAYIDHIGLIYSVMKRMSKDNIRSNTVSSVITSKSCFLLQIDENGAYNADGSYWTRDSQNRLIPCPDSQIVTTTGSAG